MTARLDPYKGKVIEGGTIRLRCKGKGHPRPRLAWEKDGAVLESDDRVYLTHGELVIRNAVLDDSGVYTCVVSNGREEARATTTVQVTMPRESRSTHTAYIHVLSFNSASHAAHTAASVGVWYVVLQC